MISDFDLGWIVGFLEGEGSISFSKQKNRNSQFLTKITFYNTDEGIIFKAEEIFGKLQFSLWKRIVRKRKNHLGKKPIYELYISRMKDIKIFLELVLPYLVSYKKQQATILLAYITHRLPLITQYRQPSHPMRRIGEKDHVFINQWHEITQSTTKS